MNKYKLIAIIGASGCGKDTILKNVLVASDDTIHKVISCTTRPIREGEEDGVHYHYLTNEQFANRILDLSMIEAASFNDWFYGTCIDALDAEKVNIGIFNPAAVEILNSRDDLDLYTVYIDTSEKNRLIRQLQRVDNPDIDEIIRRLKTDREDFLDLDFKYLTFTNNEIGDDETIAKRILTLARVVHKG